MIGETLSHYEILGLAGRGGMGCVYRARDRRLGRTVALKLLHPDQTADPRRRQRLLREARACSRLNHPGIVAVYDLGRDRDLDFLVMEWVRGQTLDEQIPKGGLPVSKALDIALQLTDALAAAHGAGVIHRDLKPRNVMIDEEGRVKILDLGIAKIDPILDRETLTGDSSTLTGEGVSPGTLAYMAPEQALGEAIDRRTDIFALGILLYEMLTGRLPFEGPHLAGLIQQLVFADPAPLSQLRAEIPVGLEALVARALAKRPEDRFPDMATLAAELRALEVADETESGAGSDPGRDSPRWSRPRWPFVAALAGALVLAAVLYGPRWEEPLPGTAELTPPASALPATPYELYTQGLEFLERFDRKGYIDLAIERFEEVIRRDETYAPAHSGLARACWRQYRLKHDPVWLHRAHDSARRALALDPQLTHARVSLARIQVSRGERDEARGELETLRRLDPANAEVVAGLAEIASLDGRAQDAVDLLEEAIRLQPGSWLLHSELGIAHSRLGDLSAAEAAFLESIAQVPDNAYARRNLAGIYHFQGRYAEAVSELQASISIRPTSVAYSNLGTIYYFQGLYREAASAFEAARRLGANSYQLWGNLGDAYRQIPGREQEAETSFQRAVQLLGRELASRPDDREAASRLALLHAKLGEAEQALAGIAGLGPPDGQSSTMLYRVAFTYELCGRRELALEALELALEGGHPLEEVENEPELTRLREDVRYHRLAVRFAPGAGR